MLYHPNPRKNSPYQKKILNVETHAYQSRVTSEQENIDHETGVFNYFPETCSSALKIDEKNSELL